MKIIAGNLIEAFTVLTGAHSEFLLLTVDEKENIWSTLKDAAWKDYPMCCGTNFYSDKKLIKEIDKK